MRTGASVDICEKCERIVLFHNVNNTWHGYIFRKHYIFSHITQLIHNFSMQQIRLPTTGNERVFDECKIKIVKLDLVEIPTHWDVIRAWKPLHWLHEPEILIRDVKANKNIVLVCHERAMTPTTKDDDTFEYQIFPDDQRKLWTTTSLHQKMRSSELDQQEVPSYYQIKIPTAGNESIFAMCGIHVVEDGVIEYPCRYRLLLPTKVNNIVNCYVYDGKRLILCIIFGKAYYYVWTKYGYYVWDRNGVSDFVVCLQR